MRRLPFLFLPLALLTGWRPGPTFADSLLNVSAPTPAESRSLADWYERTVPAPFRTNAPLAVRVLSPTAMRAYVRGEGADDADAPQQTADTDDSGAVDGVFDANPDCITLRADDAGHADVWTFAHELGHAVWGRSLSKNDRKTYTALYEQQKRDGRLVTRYAAQDVEEGFAEAFSFSVCAPPMLYARDAQSFRFFRHWEQAHR